VNSLTEIILLSVEHMARTITKYRCILLRTVVTFLQVATSLVVHSGCIPANRHVSRYVQWSYSPSKQHTIMFLRIISVAVDFLSDSLYQVSRFYGTRARSDTRKYFLGMRDSLLSNYFPDQPSYIMKNF
jgi:hypothetical protein